MAASGLINFSGLIDNAKCFTLVRQHRWPEGVHVRTLAKTGVRLVQGAGIRHQQTLPHHWADPKQPGLDLHDACRVPGKRCGIGISAGFWLLRRSGHQPTTPCLSLLRREHYTLPHVPLIAGANRHLSHPAQHVAEQLPG